MSSRVGIGVPPLARAKGIPDLLRHAPNQTTFLIGLDVRDELCHWAATLRDHETQWKNVRPGQRANVEVDAYGREFKGKVDSIAGATGARFSGGHNNNGRARRSPESSRCSAVAQIELPTEVGSRNARRSRSCDAVEAPARLPTAIRYVATRVSTGGQAIGSRASRAGRQDRFDCVGSRIQKQKGFLSGVQEADGHTAPGISHTLGRAGGGSRREHQAQASSAVGHVAAG